VAPFPRDFILHAGTLAALPVVSPSPGFKCSTGYRYLPPGAVCGPCASPGAPAVCGVLFPHRQAGARTAISAVGEAEAARRLLAQCFDLEGLGEGAVEAIARLARLPAADLTFDDASGTAEAVNEWWRQAASEVEG
jgi:hypothetical protein